MASKVDSGGLSVISEEKNSARKHHENDDFETIYNNHKTRNAYGGVHKKKHPLMLGPGRPNPGKIISLHAASKNNLSEFTQRIMSAKLLRTKQVQNQLNETQNQLNELINENRVLRNMLKRQEGALKKYEGNHAELPQLIRSHNEEIRALKTNNKLIKSQLREANTKLKDRENELELLKDNYNKLKKLSTEKNLLEREKLQKKVDELQEVIKEQEEKIQVLSRKVLLESKNYRHHLNIEVIKHKETQKDLTSALSMISKLEKELATKEKQVPGGKVLLKRENKNLMPAIYSRSADLQPKLGSSEDSFLNRSDDKKTSIQDSPEPELELLNGSGSSDDTPSPTQDIFPDINGSKKPSPDVKTTTEITFSRSEMLNVRNDKGSKTFPTKPRKNSLPKKNLRYSKDPELNAKVMAETLNEDMKAINYLSQKVQENTLILENSEPENSLLEELKSDADKIESLSGFFNNEENGTTKTLNRRNVTKRKLEEEKETNKSGDLLPQSSQQKLENMTKTWNNIKTKIQQERKKAEEKMKELQKMNGAHVSDSTSSELEPDKVEEYQPQEDMNTSPEKELKFVNFTDNTYILQELERTDKIFSRLKNETLKVSKTSLSTPSPTERKHKADSAPTTKTKPPPDIKSFRTESFREPKYLEEFQSEYQKQNLLKALKAIDVGRNPNQSSDESEDSDENQKEKSYRQQNGLKHVKQLSSKTDKSLMAELFGSKASLENNMNFEYGTVTNASEL